MQNDFMLASSKINIADAETEATLLSDETFWMLTRICSLKNGQLV